MIEKLANQIECIIAKRLVRIILENGFEIKIFDGENFAMPQFSSDYNTIIEAMASTDEDIVWIKKPSTNQRRWIRLIYGNGEDLISDYSATFDLDPIIDEINDLRQINP